MRDVAQPGQETVYGAISGGGFFGMPVGAGDLNGDGYTDIVLSPMRASGGPANQALRSQSGEAYIVFGDGVISGTTELTRLPNLPAVEIIGAAADDLWGNEFDVLDWNGDGIDDLALCGQNHTGPPDSPRDRAGAVAVILGATNLPARIDLASPPAGIVWIYGAEAVDRLGIWCRSGDVDGDGIEDLLIGADQADGPGNAIPRVGEAYLLYGKRDLPARIDLAAPQGFRMVRITGYDQNDRFGGTVYVYDVDGDQRDDLCISAATYRFGATIGADGTGVGGGDGPDNTASDAGETVIIFASPELPAELHLSQPPYGASVTRIFGFDTGDYFGEEVAVGDYNGDGHPDVAIGALRARGEDNVDPNGGETHVFFGPIPKDTEFAANNPPAGLSHTVFYARGAGEISGDTLAFIDVDGDGLDDLMIGSPCATPPLQPDAGIVDLIFGTTQTLPAVFRLASPPAGVDVQMLWGSDPADNLCYSVAWGDFDGDGFLDPLVNAMKGDGPTSGTGGPTQNAGEVYALSGYLLSMAAGRAVATATPTPTSTPTLTPTFTFTSTPTMTSTPTPSATPGFLLADLNQDGVVDVDDLLLFLQAWHRTSEP